MSKSIWTTSTSSQCSRNSKIKQSLSHPITPPTDFRKLLGSFSPNDVLWTDRTLTSSHCQMNVEKPSRKEANTHLLEDNLQFLLFAILDHFLYLSRLIFLFSIVLFSNTHDGSKSKIWDDGDGVNNVQFRVGSTGEASFVNLIDDDSVILVSLSRSTHFTVIFGNEAFLTSIPTWKKLIDAITA
uniref:Uncharacterized protein n=1 Tax=Caenorhabditis japonica TaxID=281687 RepID=A0A8R1EVL2_CAEJA